MIRFRRILCPIDFSELSQEALGYAVDLASLYHAEVLLLHVVQPFPAHPDRFGFDSEILEFMQAQVAYAERALDETIKKRIPTTIKVLGKVVQGQPSEEILRCAANEEFDLITIATHGHTGWRHLVFGSVAEKVVRLSTVPVLSIRGHSQ